VADLFYLPRLFAYHAQTGVVTTQAETFKAMERQLLNGIMNPVIVFFVIVQPF
jgi:putative membrane protein